MSPSFSANFYNIKFLDKLRYEIKKNFNKPDIYLKRRCYFCRLNMTQDKFLFNILFDLMDLIYLPRTIYIRTKYFIIFIIFIY